MSFKRLLVRMAPKKGYVLLAAACILVSPLAIFAGYHDAGWLLPAAPGFLLVGAGSKASDRRDQELRRRHNLPAGTYNSWL